MADSFSRSLLAMEREFPFPRRRHGIWVELTKIGARTTVLCACCRTRIWRRDLIGTRQTAGDVLQHALERLQRSLKGPER